MDGKISLDARAFTASLKRYAETRKIDNATAVNRQAFQVARAAFIETHRADPGSIQSVLGADVAHEIVFLKSGKVSKSQKSRRLSLVSVKSLAYNITAAKIFRQAGKGGMPLSSEIQRRASVMVHKRMAACGYIARGWLPAIRRLAGVVRDAVGGTPEGRASPGSVRIATPGRHAQAVITNEAANPHSATGSKALVEHGARGLQAAIDATTADMAAYVQKQLEDRAREFRES